MKIYDLKCTQCEIILTDEMVDPEALPVCPECGSDMATLPVATKSYRIFGDNSASTRPKSK